jgi:hypothetical protein
MHRLARLPVIVDVRSRTRQRFDGFERHAIVGSNDFREEIIVDEFDLLQEAEHLRVEALPVVAKHPSKAEATVALLNDHRGHVVRSRLVLQLSIPAALQIASNARLNVDNRSC